MLIGEAPGMHEDRQGRPFIGASGQFLTELLRSAGLRREDVFITNVVKHRPPDNRDPQPEEINACAEFLDAQIAALDPHVIITLGRFSMARWFPGERIMRIHGKPRQIDGRTIVPMMHPAAALHQPQNRPLLSADFERLPAMLAESQRVRSALPAPTAPTPPPGPAAPPPVGQHTSDSPSPPDPTGAVPDRQSPAQQLRLFDL
jgi:uracil-DNA glycosylase family 4